MSNRLVDCPIWGTPCKVEVIHGENRAVDGDIDEAAETIIVNSERTGGAYEIAAEARRAIDALEDAEIARLTSWLVEQRNQGNRVPLVTSKIVEDAKKRRPLRVQERAERLLRYIAKKSNVVGYRLGFEENPPMAALAWTESTDWREVHFFFDYLEKMDWLNGRGVGIGIGTCWVEVTVAGYDRIAEQAKNVNSAQAFVAMWFDESMTKAYEKGIRPAIEEAGYTPARIDQKEHINKIDDEIIAEIRRSRFLVADFTQGGDGARGGVYYEAGFARGLGIPVIFTCRASSLDDLHFDTEHYNHIVWTDEDQLREKLKKRILAVIGEGPETQRNPIHEN